MTVEGRLDIAIAIGGAEGNRVTIETSRPLHASQILVGKRIEEAVKALPLLFNICGTAQSCAGVRACEAELGVSVTGQSEWLRNSLVELETIREHLWRVLLDWSQAMGEAPDQETAAQVNQIYREYRQLLSSNGSPMMIGGINSPRQRSTSERQLYGKLQQILLGPVLAMEPAAWLAIDSEAALIAWASRGEGIAARMVADVVERGWQQIGRCQIAALGEQDGATLQRHMDQQGYIERPYWHNGPCETSSLTRTHSPLLEALTERYGNGLLVRLVARLVEAVQLAQRQLDGAGEDHPSANPLPPPLGGIAMVEAARGRLVHRLEQLDGSVSRYQILAPTEWNFHPDGVVVRALQGLRGADGEVERQARLLIGSIDPCVGYELSIVDA